MSRAITVGKNAMRSSYPNPMVGCVIVHRNKIISEGFTSPFTGPHAEANAIENLKNKALLAQATLYVTLEPCAHYGNTPPCALLITKYHIPKVVIGLLDPNPKVAGKGIKILQDAGVQVTQGVLEQQCRRHHKRFLTVQKKHRPYVVLKWAQSADAFIAPPLKNRKPYWLSSALSKQKTHQWRAQEHAVLIGANTLVHDQPKLDTRLWHGPLPIPVYIDKNLSLPRTAPLFTLHQKIICITEISTNLSHTPRGLKVLKVNFKKPLASQILKALHHLGIFSVIIEGGGHTLALFIKENLWDEARIFKCPTLLKQGIKAPTIQGVLQTQKLIGPDVLETITPTFDSNL